MNTSILTRSLRSFSSNLPQSNSDYETQVDVNCPDLAAQLLRSEITGQAIPLNEKTPFAEEQFNSLQEDPYSESSDSNDYAENLQTMKQEFAADRVNFDSLSSQNIDGTSPLTADEANEENFKRMLDKYYTDFDEAQAPEDAPSQVSESEQVQGMNYYLSNSSSYYQQNSINFTKEVKSFEQRVSETISDYKNQYSGLEFSDGPYLGKKISKAEADQLMQSLMSSDGAVSFQNRYLSGYETAKEIPKAPLFQAAALPLFVAITAGVFIVNNAKGTKNGESRNKVDKKD